jgi:hypothetical protein
MTPEGYEILRNVLDDNPETEGAYIRPIPGPGENVREVEIRRPKMKRQTLAKVLQESGLTRLNTEPHPDPNAPSFKWADDPVVRLGQYTVYRFADTKV